MDAKQLKTNLKNFLLVATDAEMEGELQLSIERGDTLRASLIRELMEEWGIPREGGGPKGSGLR